jgi:hypothetical protein
MSLLRRLGGQFSLVNLSYSQAFTKTPRVLRQEPSNPWRHPGGARAHLRGALSEQL